MPNVVLTRLLSEAAHRHILDHAGAQRTDAAVGKIGGHRGFLSRAEGCWTFDARDRMPRSSRLPVHAFTVAAEYAPTVPPTPSRESGFVHCPKAAPHRIGPNRRVGR